MEIENLKKRKKSLKITNQDIANLTGIPVSTINKIFSGTTKSPRYDTLLAIEDAIEKKELHADEITRYEYGVNLDNPMMVEERNNYAFNVRKYTEEDLTNIPEGNYAELIDGEIYFMGTPTLTHERIIMRMSKKITDYIENRKGKCEVFSGHYAMRLKEMGEDGESNIFLPDIMVVCNPTILKEEICDGPADWIIEVASPDNYKNDYQKKVYHYRKGGVREYWIIDPMKKIVTVFDYESEYAQRQEGISLYAFDEEISVNIYAGLGICMADMGF